MICPVCNKEFTKAIRKQKFCSEICRRKHYRETDYNRYHPPKEHYVAKLPVWICQNPACRHKMTLNFFPLKNPEKMVDLKCPKCGYYPYRNPTH